MVVNGFLRFAKKYIFKASLAFSKYRLSVRYMTRYGKVESGVVGRVKLLASLIGCDPLFGANATYKCVVKPSKLIISDKNSGFDLFVFDRPASGSYWKMRKQWSEFHDAPDYFRVDEQAYHQRVCVSTGTLLSLSLPELCEYLCDYLRKQIDLQNRYGMQMPVSSFLEEPYKLLADSGRLVKLPRSVIGRVESMMSSDRQCVVVPSVIEPWPVISHTGVVFTDLSPVEFRLAPVLHDLCYILMKYEMYGSRHQDHKPFLALLLGKVRENSIDKSNTVHLVELVDQMRSVVTFDELMESYVLMIMVHCYVKYQSTGRFIRGSREARLVEALKRHVSVFNSIGSDASF